MMAAMRTTATTTPVTISGVLEAGAGSAGVVWKARNASVLPLGSTLLSDMGKTIAKRRSSADHRTAASCRVPGGMHPVWGIHPLVGGLSLSVGSWRHDSGWAARR